MPNGNHDFPFDDADELGARLEDGKAFDKLRVSTIAEARSIIDSFVAEEGGGAWPSLDRAEVGARLLELIGPESSDQEGSRDEAGRAMLQGALNLCGPAAFFQSVIKRDPVMFANYATNLFNSGEGDLGNLHVAPSSDIVSTIYADLLPRMNGSICPQADWMVLGALRNSTNAFWTGSFQGTPEEVFAAGTRPGELAEWLEQTGLYRSVSNEANWMQRAGIPHATNLPLFDGNDTAVLIHSNLIKRAKHEVPDSNWPLTEFPNHWVMLLGEAMQNVTDGSMFFNIWSWGSRQILQVPQDAFLENYYGAVTCKLKQ